jgi:uncharacterized protein (DUF433 family)
MASKGVEGIALTRKFLLRGRNPPWILRVLNPVPATADKTIESTRGDLGTGVYALGDLRRFVSFSGTPDEGAKVARWLRTALNPADHHRWQADYSFSDLVSLFVVRELRQKGVSPQTIRAAEDYLRLKWRTDRPFAREDIKTDGVEVLCDDDPDAGPAQIEGAGLRGQQMLRHTIEDSLESVYYSDKVAAYWMPSAGVIVDPRVQFGAPVVAGTRIPTDAVAGVAKALGVERAVRRFDISTDLVESAIQFEDEIASS